MEKNVRILDVNGNEISFTYPKRAKGLVKNGRAVYVDDCTIRFLHTLPTTIEFDNSEGEITMSNLLCFNARDFRFDKSCENNVGSRMFITDMFGESVEVYEIGDGKDNVTQIQTVKELDKNTDYTFRFALTTSKDLLEGTTQFMIVPISGETETEDDWENRYTFNLSQNQYKASCTKLWGINLIRVYEIPFNTEDVSKFRFVFMNKHSVARIYPAKELESYNTFQDFSYAGWLNDKKEQIEKSVKEFDLDKTIKSATEATKKAADVVTEKLKSAYEGISNTVKNATAQESNFENHKNENLDENQFASILAKAGDSCNINFSNCNITDSAEKTVDQGGAKDCLNILACNSNIGGKSFATLISKIGDASNIDISNSNILEVPVQSTFTPADGLTIVVKNTSITASAFATLMSVVGDGANIDMGGTVIADDGSDFSFGQKQDGIKIKAVFATVPDSIKEKIYLKFGEGCEISGI